MRISDWSSDVCSSDLSASPVIAVTAISRPAYPLREYARHEYSLREHVDMSFREPVLVFDIETIPDLDGGRRLMGLEQMNDAEVWAAMTTQRLAQKGNDFIPGHLQRRSAERRIGEEWCTTCRVRGAPK